MLDVNDEEARQLLLTIDPLVSLACEQEQIRQRLLEITPVESPELKAAWQATADDLGFVQLEIQADVAVDYFTLRTLDGELAVLRSSVEVRNVTAISVHKHKSSGGHERQHSLIRRSYVVQLKFRQSSP